MILPILVCVCVWGVGGRVGVCVFFPTKLTLGYHLIHAFKNKSVTAFIKNGTPILYKAKSLFF